MKRWPRDQREKNGIFQRPAGKNRLKKKKKKKKKICVSSFSVRSPSWSRGSASTPLKTFFSYECHQSAVSTARPRPLASTLGRSFVRRWAPVINTVAKFTLTGLILRHDSAVHPQVHFFSSPPSQCLRSFLFFLFFLSLSIPPPTVVASRFFEEDDRTVFPFPFFFFPIFFCRAQCSEYRLTNAIEPKGHKKNRNVAVRLRPWRTSTRRNRRRRRRKIKKKKKK